MKAITVTYKGWTETKPSSYLVRAEGVKSRSYCTCSNTVTDAAYKFVTDNNWLKDGERLVSGTLPNGDTVFVFNREG